MHPVLDGLATTATPTPRAPSLPCPECLASFRPTDQGQLFCCQSHRRAWNNRWTVRGAKMAPLAAVARLTRNGSRARDQAGRTYGARAGRDVDVLLRRWQREDELANDGRGRMGWAEYLARRYGSGFDPL